MAKRLRDSARRKLPSYQRLSFKAKGVLTYLEDNCESSGLWPANFELSSAELGVKFDDHFLEAELGDRVWKVDSERYFVKTFFDEQYLEAEDGFKAKRGAIAKLKAIGLMDEDGTLRKLLPNSSNTVQELLPNSPIILDQINSSSEGGAGGNKKPEKPAPPKFDFESLYKAYPRHEGKDAGMRHIAAQIGDDPAKFPEFSKAVGHYAALMQRRKTEIKHMKLWSTFVGTSKTEYPWREYIARPAELDTPTAAPPSRYGPPSPPAIRVESAEQTAEANAKLEAARVAMSDEERKAAMAKVHEMLEKTPNLGFRRGAG